MLSREELDRIAAADEKRLGVGSKEFMERHNEIMELIDKVPGKENRIMKPENAVRTAKTFKSYAETDVSALEGYTVDEVLSGINEMDTGMMIELSRTIDDAVLGITIVYDSDCCEGEPPLLISNEFVRKII